MNDIVAGHVDLMFDTFTTSLPSTVGGPGEDGRDREPQAQSDPARRARDRRILSRLPLDHLVRSGRAARHAGRNRRQDQPRRGRDHPKPRGQRAAARNADGAGRLDARGSPALLQRGFQLWGKVIREAHITVIEPGRPPQQAGCRRPALRYAACRFSGIWRSAMRKLAVIAFTAVLGIVWGDRAQAQFPSKTVRIVVPYPAGGGTDILGRFLADQLGRKWNQSVIVENIGGAAGNIGAADVFRAAPDGHTLLVTSPGPVATNSFLYKDMPYDPKRWTAIALLATGPYVLTMRKSFEGATVKDLIARAKASRAGSRRRSRGQDRSRILRPSSLRCSPASRPTRCPIAGSARR